MAFKVACFYWLGDRWGVNERGIEYINKLYRGVQRNLPLPFQFICYTNESIQDQLDQEITVKPLEFPASLCGAMNLPRGYMFCLDSGLTQGDQVLVLDLDIVIVGSLNDIASYTGDFCVRSAFHDPTKKKMDGDIIGFRPSRRLEELFWDNLINDYQEALQRTGGSERYWLREVVGNNFSEGDCDRWEQVCPAQIISFKLGMRDQGQSDKLPANARIVSCHGTPQPHQLKYDWVKENWR